MASKLKNRQKVEATRALASECQKTSDDAKPDRRASREDGDEFPVSNIATKIAQRRLPRRTPTSHVKGVSGELIRRRLSKTASIEGGGQGQGGNVASKRLNFESSIDNSLDEPGAVGAKPSAPSRQTTLDRSDKS